MQDKTKTSWTEILKNSRLNSNNYNEQVGRTFEKSYEDPQVKMAGFIRKVHRNLQTGPEKIDRASSRTNTKGLITLENIYAKFREEKRISKTSFEYVKGMSIYRTHRT